MKEKVIEIIAQVLGVPTSEVTVDTEIGELDEWDSLRNMQIFSSLQEAYSVKISQEMLVDLENVSDIIDLIESLR